MENFLEKPQRNWAIYVTVQSTHRSSEGIGRIESDFSENRNGCIKTYFVFLFHDYKKTANNSTDGVGGVAELCGSSGMADMSMRIEIGESPMDE